MARSDLVLPLLLALGAACAQPCEGGEGDEGCGEADPAADDDACPDEGAEVVFADGNGYAFDGALDIASTDLADGVEPVFDWSGLTRDLQGHPLDPASEVDNAAVVVLRDVTEEEVEHGLSNDSLEQSAVALYVSWEPAGATEAALGDMTMLGTDIDVEQYFHEGYGVWLLVLTTGTVPGVGTRMAAFFRPVPGAPDTRLVVTDESTVLDYEVDLESLAPVALPAGSAQVTVDWSGIATDARGDPFVASDVDQLTVGRYEGLTPAGLEAVFLDLDLIADASWTMGVSGASRASLGALEGDSGPFPGVDGDSTWVLALRCSTCTNPAPPFLALLEPCP